MNQNITYENLALEWSPVNNKDRRFLFIALGAILTGFLIGFILSSIEVPVVDRKAKTVIPERISQLILEQEKKKPVVIPKPKPVPKPLPEPEIEPETRVKKKVEKAEVKPLTQVQKQAREKAQESGLLALSSELADLIDTPEINSMVGSKLSSSTNAEKATSINKSLLTEGTNRGSSGVNSAKYADAKVNSTGLTAQEMTVINQSLISKPKEEAGDKSKYVASGNERGEEEIALVFDQNKSKLYSIYNRERRKNVGLKGKIVIEVTIAPDGTVTSVRLVSSELNFPKLENSLLSRIKQFKFSPGKKEPITLTYPIEFLPS